MGTQFYFFTDPSCLKPQLPEKAFGAVSTAGGSDIFHVTSVHELLSPAPAVAICDGVLCAQEDGPGTLTLILKPSQSAPFDAPTVSYFIYKGIARSSLLNAVGDQVLDDQDANANDLTKTVAVEWKTLNQGSLVGSRAGLGLDRDANFPPDDGSNPPKIFTGTDPVERLFAYPHKSYQLPVVKAGDVLGTFEGVCGFEIVLLRLGYKPELSWTRRADNSVSVVTISSDNGGTPWQADDHAFFSHWHDKEQVLAFLDPTAYFGAFVQSKLYKKSGGVASKVGNIYQDLLASFTNRNAAWLDIRGNAGYSYNLFGLYADTIRFVSYSDVSQTSDKDFRAGGWPLLKLEIGDVPGSKPALAPAGALGINYWSVHRTRLCLPVGLSTAPAVLVSKGFARHLGAEPAKFKAPAISRANSADAYYSSFPISLPVIRDNSQDVLVCSYTRVNLYERVHRDPQSMAPLDVAGDDYLDGLFRFRDLYLDQNFSTDSLRFQIFPEDILVDMGLEFGHVYAGAVGIAEDAGKVVLFVLPTTFLRDELNAGRPRIAASLPDAFKDSSGTFEGWLQAKFPNSKITRTTIDPGTTHEVDVVIARDAAVSGGARLSGLGRIADYGILTLAKSDHTALLAAIAAAGSLARPVFSTVSNVAEKLDLLSNVPYAERTLVATDYQWDGAAKTVKCVLSWSKAVVEYADY